MYYRNLDYKWTPLMINLKRESLASTSWSWSSSSAFSFSALLYTGSSTIAENLRLPWLFDNIWMILITYNYKIKKNYSCFFHLNI